MGFWTKVIGGAVIGVGAVAAAPFTGGGSILGAATLAGSLTGASAAAASAGAMGAAAGAVMGRRKEEQHRQQRDKDKQQAKQEYVQELEKLRDELAIIIRDIEVREQFLVTLFAVGICAANADHEICGKEKEELEELVAGLGRREVLSNVALKRVEEWYKRPPQLLTVWQIIKNNGFDKKKHILIFDKIIRMVIMADDVENHHEAEFIEAWNHLVA